MDINVELKNVEQTIKKMAMYSAEKEKEIDKVTKKYAKEVAKRAKANAPVGPTGNLKASIRPKYFRRLGPSATVFPRGSKGAHRHLVEYGTGSRRNKGNKRTGNRGRMPAKPFMKPAHESVVGQYLSDMRGVVDKVDTI
ncbi:MAG: HK97 gp10 family phage protein [Bacillaceae bacterium]|nr:HK97 gp10 family phage protein [Bacillaceae bacterium]